MTGATGFLGGHVVRGLAARGDKPIGVGRRADHAPRDAPFIVCDLGALDAAERLAEASGPIDAVVHAAALSSPWGRWSEFRRANVEGTRAALEAARRHGARRFVFISSPSVCFRFADQIEVREADALPEPVNAYARSKQLAEALVLAASDLEPVVLRPRGLYGQGDMALLPRLIRAARKGRLPLLRGGHARTDITHIDDVTTAVLAALDAPAPTSGGVFNVSGGEALKVTDIAEAAAARAGTRVHWRRLPVGLALAGAGAMEVLCSVTPGRPEPPITRYGVGVFAFTQTLNLTAARLGLGWAPRVSWAEGLERTFGGKA